MWGCAVRWVSYSCMPRPVLLQTLPKDRLQCLCHSEDLFFSAHSPLSEGITLHQVAAFGLAGKKAAQAEKGQFGAAPQYRAEAGHAAGPADGLP